MKNLLEGLTFPVADLKTACDTLRERLKAHKDTYEVERAPALAMLRALQEQCKHPGAKTGYNQRDGDWMNPCPVCGATK